MNFAHFQTKRWIFKSTYCTNWLEGTYAEQKRPVSPTKTTFERRELGLDSIWWLRPKGSIEPETDFFDMFLDSKRRLYISIHLYICHLFLSFCHFNTFTHSWEFEKFERSHGSWSRIRENLSVYTASDALQAVSSNRKFILIQKIPCTEIKTINNQH